MMTTTMILFLPRDARSAKRGIAILLRPGVQLNGHRVFSVYVLWESLLTEYFGISETTSLCCSYRVILM